MFVFAASCIISVLLITFLLLICTKSKKKVAVTTVSYHQKKESYVEAQKPISETSHDTTVLHKQANQNGNEYRRPHSASQTSRELPQVPVIGHETNSLHSSANHLNGSNSELSGSGGSPETKHHSPKGRRLPTPPPEELQTASEKHISVSMLETEDEDMYAKVGDQPKSDPVRLKIKTLDITEGSGDSSFYAKVGDVVVEDGDDLYAQVDNETTDKKQSNKPSTSSVCDKSRTPTAADTTDNINYGDAEYASIDKMRKSITKKKPVASEEPPAPPIPERNFDVEDEVDVAGGNENEQEEEVEQQESGNGEESQTGPMYAKLCVRESLDHLRHRQEVENERRQRYANIMRPTDVPNANTSEVYAQIDETNPEAVYESVSASGSADGAFQPRDQSNRDYSSIQDMSSNEGLVEHDISAPTTSHHPNNARPSRQHHYEQIQRPT